MVRFKNRYTVIEIIPNDTNKSDNKSKNVQTDKLYHVINDNILKYYGEFGAAAIFNGFKVMYCNEKTKIAIIRARHGPHRLVTSILPLITVVFGELVRIRTLYIGATIIQCQKFIIKHQNKYIDRIAGKIINQSTRKKFITSVMSLKGFE